VKLRPGAIRALRYTEGNSLEDFGWGVSSNLFFSQRFFIAVCALLSGSLGPGSAAHASSPVSTVGVSGEPELDTGLKLLTSIYRLAEENAADKVSPDKSIYDGAIPGMLRTLDPHSNFFDPKEFNKLREDQRGRYYGVGMTISQHGAGGPTVVVYPFPVRPPSRPACGRRHHF